MYPQPHQTRQVPAHPPAPFRRPPDQPANYCPIPQRLIADLRDNVLAIGLYALVGRLYLIHQAPIPLSRADVLRYDPTLKAGAVKRAFDRLVAGGWLIEAIAEGRRKQRYTPTWGRVKGAALPWQVGQPCLGRPRHIARLPLDRGLLDVCMGKLVPHATRVATITRYVTTPALSLADVGCYALTLAEIPHATPSLRWLGLVRHGQALPLPAEQRLLAIISQRALALDDDSAHGRETELTMSGTRRLGLAPLPPAKDAGGAQPLFFVPPGLIGSSIGPLIGSLIGQDATDGDAPAAPTGDEIRSDVRPGGITWESSDSRDQQSPPPTPPTPPAAAGGGGSQPPDRKEGTPARGARHPVKRGRCETALEIPDTEATRLLRTINVRPEQLTELAEIPTATIEAAIADGKARASVRDQAGWVVSLLRAHRDYGWKIAPPPPRPDSPEALRAALARYAAEQEADRRAGLPDDQPWFSPPAPISLDAPGALVRLWNEVQAAVKAQTSRAEFDAWIRRVTLLGVERGVATIVAPNVTVKSAIEDRFLGQLRELLAMYVGEALDVRVILNPCAPAQGARPAPAATPPEPATPAEPAERPDWIAAERWVALPAMLRAALIGSALVDGELRAASPYLGRLLRTRYAREVGELIAAQ